MRAETTRRIKKLGRDGKPREAVAELANMAKLGIQVGGGWRAAQEVGAGTHALLAAAPAICRAC